MWPFAEDKDNKNKVSEIDKQANEARVKMDKVYKRLDDAVMKIRSNSSSLKEEIID